MFNKSFAAAVASAVVAFAALPAVANPTALTMYYDPETGNVKLQNTTSGTLQIQDVQLTTLGNGTVGDPSGRPGNIGWLSGTSVAVPTAATLPTAAFTTSNTNAIGLNGIYSEIFAGNVGTPILTLDPYASWTEANPIGPAGSFWDFGNITVLGMTQGDLNTRFLTNPEVTPPDFDAAAFGQFLVSYRAGTSGAFTSGLGNVSVVTAVPEPSTYALALAGLAGCGLAMRRRKKA